MAHLHEKVDFTVEVFIVFEDKVLLRRHDKYDKWLGVGGHVELDEEPNQAAIREVKEEVGLEVELIDRSRRLQIEDSGYSELIPPRYMNIHDINTTHKHVAMIYFAKSESDEVIEKEGEQSKGYKWMTKADLEKNEENVSEVIRFYATRALES